MPPIMCSESASARRGEICASSASLSCRTSTSDMWADSSAGDRAPLCAITSPMGSCLAPPPRLIVSLRRRRSAMMRTKSIVAMAARWSELAILVSCWTRRRNVSPRSDVGLIVCWPVRARSAVTCRSASARSAPYWSATNMEMLTGIGNSAGSGGGAVPPSAALGFPLCPAGT